VARPLAIRIARAADADAIAAIYAPIVRDTAIPFEIEAPSAAVMAQRITTTLPTHPWLVAESEGVILGYAYATPHRERAAYRWSTDVSAYIDAHARRSGIGRALYRRLIQILQKQGFHSAFAGITLPNSASVGLHEAVGFKPLGTYEKVGFKQGEWRDVGWWRLSLSDDTAAPHDPIPFDNLQTTVRS